MDIPSGTEHIKLIAELSEKNRKLSSTKLNCFNDELHQIGVALSIIYQVATCHRKCFGGGHVLEALCGRTYNLATSAYILTCRGLYDEALSLIRSMGEISNLIHLSIVDKNALKIWLSADSSTRKKSFSPYKIRMLLEKANVEIVIANKDWYSKFCEDYTHIHAQTKPNFHNKNNGNVGGVIQEAGMKYVITELVNLSFYISVMVAHYADMADMIDQFNLPPEIQQK
jgi:hypothetical protein